MTDTVWLKLTLATGNSNFYMFGPTGIVEFYRSSDDLTTVLIKARGGSPAEVSESPAYIMDMLGKIRNTVVKPNRSKNDTKVKGRSKR